MLAALVANKRIHIKYSVLCRKSYIVKCAYGTDSAENLVANLRIALLTDIVKQTIIYVKCCADSSRLYRCVFIAFV